MHAKYARLIPRPRASPQDETDGRPMGPNMWQKVTAWMAKIPPLLKRIPVRRILPFVLTVLVVLAIVTLVYWLMSHSEEKIDDRDFTRGVLAVNMEKSVYTPGESVLFQLASLDARGDTLCHSNLRLEVRIPGAKQPTILTTKDNQIITSSTCGDNNVTNEPDYIARMVVNSVGTYKVKLTNLDTGKKVASSFVVQDVSKQPAFSIQRSSATRINPFKSDRYPMVITVTAKEDFAGTIVEQIPSSFTLIWQGPSVVGEEKDHKTVTWSVSLKAGESQRLAYEYMAPQVSPEFYKLGHTSIRDVNGRSVYEDLAQWQIASDASCVSNGTGNWTTITWTNCASGPGTGDTVTISNNNTVTLNTSPTVLSLTINNGATLTNDGNARTLTLTNTTGTIATNNGTFTPSTFISVTITSDASVTILSGSWTNSNAFYNLTLSPALGGTRTYTMGAAVHVNNNWTSSPTSSQNRDLVVNLSGGVTVGGTLTLSGTGCTTADSAAATTQFSTNGQHMTVGWIVVNGVTSGDNCNFTTANSSIVYLVGTSGTLFTLGQSGSTATMTTESLTSWIVSPASGTPTLFATSGSTITLNTLKIDASAATVINAGANFTIAANAPHMFWVANGVFNLENRTITAGANTTLKIDDPGILCLGGTTGSTTADCVSGAAQTTAQALPSFTTYTFSSGSTIRYLSDNNTTISNTPTYGNLELKPKFVTTSYTYTLGGAMTINGNFTINPDESGAGTPALTVNMGGTTTVASTKTTTITRTNSATSTLDTNPGTSYNLSTGFLTIGTSGTLDAGSSTSTITLTGITGTLFSNSGAFTQGTSTVTVTSASGTPTLLNGSSSTTFSTLTLNSAATVINGGNAFTVGTNMNVSQGVFNANAQITGPGASGTLTVSSGATLCLGGGATNTTNTCDSVATSGSGITMPTFQTYTFTGSTIRYLSNAATSVSNTPTYNNLIFNPVLTADKTYTIGGAMTINGDLDIIPSGTANTLLVNLGGTTTLGATKTVYVRRSGSNALSNLDAVNGANHNLSAGFVNIGTGGTYTARASTITLTGTSGTLFTNSGSFTAGTSTVTATSASGTPTLLNGSSSTTFSTLTLNSAATVINGGNAFTIGTNMNVSQGVFNANAAITGPGASGTLTVSSGATLCLGGGATNTTNTCDSVATSTGAITLPTFQTYTFTGSTIRYLSNADTSVSNTPTYNNLIFNPILSADKTYTIGGAVTINGDFDIIPSGTANTLLVNLGGTTSLGATKTVYVRRSGSNALSNLDAVNGANHNLSAGFVNIGTGGTYTARASTITLTGTSGTLFSNSGTFTQGTSTVTVTSASGTPALLGGSTSTTFSTLTLNSAATVINGGSSAFTVSGNMNVSQGVFNANEAITGPGASGTLTVSSGATLCLGGGAINTTATCDSVATSANTVPMPTFQTYTLTGSTVRYLSDYDTTISGSPTYNNLIFNPILTGDHIYAFDGAVTINGDFTSNPTASSSYALTTALGGTTTIAASKTISLTGTTSGTSTIDTMPSGSSYNLSAGYINIGTAGTLDAGGSTSTITLTGTSATPLFTLAGAFTAGSSTVVFNPDADVTLTSGAFTFNNLSLTPAISTAGRAYTFGSGTQTVNGDFLIQPSGTQLLTVNMAGSITVSNTKTTTITRSSTATSKLVPGASSPALSSGNIAIASGGALDGTSSSSVVTLTANGTPLSVAGTYTPGSTTISYIPASTSGVNVASTTYYNVIFNKASNTFSLATSGITVTNDLTITAGVLDAVNGSNFPITVGRNWTNTPGTSGFEARQGTVTFNTATTGTISGATTFYNFTSTAAGKTIKFNDSTTYRINGLLTLTGSAGPTYVTLDSVSGNPSWTINHQGTESVSYTSVKNSACDGTSQEINAFGANNYDAGGNGTCWLFTEPLASVNYSFWKMDEGYSTTAHDSTDAVNTGTLAGTTKPTWQNEEYCVSGKCLYFEGTTAKVTTSEEVNVRTVSFWVRPVSTTTTFLQLNNSDYISASSGTLSATGFTATFYVDGVAKSTIEAGKWQHIVATTGTTVSGSAIILGNNSTNYYQGLMDEVRLDSTEYTAGQVKGDYIRRGAPDPVSAQFSDQDYQRLYDGLVGYWKMDESSGNATDSSGNATTLTNSASTPYVTAKFGNGADLESGSNQYFSVADNTVLSITGSLTLAAWIKPESVSAGTYNIISKWDGANVSYRLMQNADEIRLELNDTNNYIETSASNLVQDTWYQVVGVYDSAAATARIYINGIQATVATTGTIPSAIGDDGGKFHIGAQDSTGGASNYYDGIIDEARVYKRALSEYEIRSLYTLSPSPIAYYKLDEGSGTTANDSSGNSYTGTLTNSPVWGTGKYGSGVAMNGSQQYISVSDNANLRLSGDFTLSGWVRPQSASKDYLLLNNNAPLMQKIDGTDGYELGITQDGIPYGMLTNVSKTWTRYDNGSSADCSFGESYDDGCVISISATNNWDDAQVYTPFVFKEGSTYKMYYGGNDGSKVSVGLATSTNGYSWTRNSGNNCSSTGDGCVLPYGGASSWNINASYFPSVIKDGGTYKMWFGGSDGTNVRIGYATSTDGANWTLYNGNNCSGTSGNGCIFNIGTSGNWDAKFVTAPSVIKDGSTYKMWYSGRDASNVDRIGYATSSDGITWTRNSGNNCSTSGDGCIVGLGGANTWYATLVSGPRVIKDGALYHMVFNGIKTGDDHYRLGYATSTDGVTWTKYDNTSSAACGYSESYDEGCILDYGSANSWDDRYLVYPTFLKDGPTMRIWYSGIRVGGNYRIGYATFTPGITDTTAISGDTYHHLAFTKSGTSLSLYVDGVLKTTGTTAVTTIANTSALLSGNSLYGSLDDLRIYNYARSQTEITRDMNAGHPAPGSPVGSAVIHYKFDEGTDNTCSGGTNDVCNSGSGRTTYDGAQSGMAVPATATSGWTRDGKFGNALNFDADNDYISVPAISNLSSFSWSLWFKTRAVNNDRYLGARTTNVTTFLRKGTNCAQNKIEFGVYAGGWQGGCSTSSIVTDTWYHLVAVYNETTHKAQIYINGRLDASATTTGTVSTSAGGLNIGAAWDGASVFDGTIDEVKIYDFALSENQVKVEYNQGKSQVMGSLSTASDGKTGDNSAARAYCPPGNLEGNCDAGQDPAPVAEWKFDEGTGQSVNDTTGHSNTGVLGSSGGVDSADPSWIGGKFGKALNFDGDNDYVEVSGLDPYEAGGSISFMVWIKPSVVDGSQDMILSRPNPQIRLELAGGDFRVNLGDGADWCIANFNGGPVEANKWQHLAATYNHNTKILTLYRNGVITNSTETTCTLDNSGSIYIGQYELGGYNFPGAIDEVRFYSYARTPAQVAWDYNRGAPIAWYKLDECGGTVIHSSNDIYDSALDGSWSGSGGDQTSLGDCETVGSAWYNGATGKYNGSLNFDGTDDEVDLGTTYPNLTGWTSFSVTGWFNSANTSARASIVSKFNDADQGYGTSVFNVWHESGELRFKLSVDGGWDGAYVKYPTVSNSTWHHFAAVWDGTNYKIYVDGKFGEQASRTGVMTNPATNFYIGRMDDATPRWFNGKIDDIRVYNYALSEQQIKLNYNGGQAVNFR